MRGADVRWGNLAGPLGPEGVDEWFLCGPPELTTLVRDTLVDRGVTGGQIHLELFFGFEQHHERPARADAQPATLTFTLSGREQTVDLKAEDSILEGALQTRPDAPYACMGGACGTCRAKLLDGTVEMDHNYALGQAELDAGFILTCQSHPTSSTVHVDYDAPRRP